jgi:hypothetical protein
VVRLFAEFDAGEAKELGDLLDDGRGDALLAQEVGGDGDVLLEEGEAEGAREGAREDSLRDQVLGGVGAAAGGVDDVERRRRRDPGLRQRGQAFGRGPDVHREQCVVHRL